MAPSGAGVGWGWSGGGWLWPRGACVLDSSYRDNAQVKPYSGCMRCVMCGRAIAWSGRGRRPETCGQRCRKRKSREPVGLPSSLTSLDRWAARDGKRPVQLTGQAASSTDPGTWTTYAAVAERPHGVMLGDGLACWDLDDVLDESGVLHPDAVAVLDQVGRRALWVERSMSGHGLHVFVRGEQAPARVGKRVSYYSWGRFIAVTGDRYRRAV